MPSGACRARQVLRLGAHIGPVSGRAAAPPTRPRQARRPCSDAPSQRARSAHRPIHRRSRPWPMHAHAPVRRERSRHRPCRSTALQRGAAHMPVDIEVRVVVPTPGLSLRRELTIASGGSAALVASGPRCGSRSSSKRGGGPSTGGLNSAAQPTTCIWAVALSASRNEASSRGQPACVTQRLTLDAARQSPSLGSSTKTPARSGSMAWLMKPTTRRPVRRSTSPTASGSRTS